MNIDRKELSRWLKVNPLWDRDRLCAELGIKKRTLYNWTSGSSEIPQKYIGTLKRLMEGAEEIPQKVLTDTFSITIDEERFLKYSEAARLSGMNIKEWLISVADEEAEFDSTLPNPYSMQASAHEVKAPDDADYKPSLDPARYGLENPFIERLAKKQFDKKAEDDQGLAHGSAS